MVENDGPELEFREYPIRKRILDSGSNKRLKSLILRRVSNKCGELVMTGLKPAGAFANAGVVRFKGLACSE